MKHIVRKYELKFPRTVIWISSQAKFLYFDKCGASYFMWFIVSEEDDVVHIGRDFIIVKDNEYKELSYNYSYLGSFNNGNNGFHIFEV